MDINTRNNDIDDNNVSGNNGNNVRDKFSDRIKKIRKDKLKKDKIDNIEEESKVKYAGRNVIKVILAVPGMIYDNIVYNKTDNSDSKKGKISDEKTFSSIPLETFNGSLSYNNKRIKVNRIKDIDVSLLKKKQEIYLKDTLNFIGLKSKETIFIDETQNKINKLQKEIIDLIKKKLMKNVNELEMLQSELYLLNELTGGDIYLSECQQDIKEIRKLLSKIKALKEKYDYLKDNIDFEYMLEFDDDFLIDKILELKEICSRDDIKYVVDNYKILDEYKFLYLKIDKLEEDTIKFEEHKNKKVEELKERDIDFEEMKNEVYDIDRENERYNSFVIEQELFLKNLDEKVSQIDSHEEVTYRYKGFTRLLGNSFKYLGLLLLNPLKGFIPGIATQTLITKNLIHNLYNNLELEENRKMVYEAIDYSNSINAAINDLDNTSNLINSTLEDIINLKFKYEQQFSKYEGSFSGYRDAIKKINKMENAVLGSKIKIDMMKEKMKVKEKQNESKLKMVKKLNDSSVNKSVNLN